MSFSLGFSHTGNNLSSGHWYYHCIVADSRLDMLDWSEPATPAPMPAARHQPIITLAVADATGLGTIARGASRVSVDDKAMINCRADVNQLLPLKYKWAWEKYPMAATTTGCRRKSPCRPTTHRATERRPKAAVFQSARSRWLRNTPTCTSAESAESAEFGHKSSVRNATS